MAARKSCTHLTWAEAKAKAGASSNTSSSSGGNKGSGNVKRENHGKLLAAKIVAKAGPSESEAIENRQAARRARRDQQRQEQLEAQRQAEKERQRLEAVAKPHEQALERLQELAVAYRQSQKSSELSSSPNIVITPDSGEDLLLSLICESKQLQVDELIALQAIYADTPDILVVADDCRLEELQQHLEAWQMLDASSSIAESSSSSSSSTTIANHPPLRMVLKRSVEDPSDDDWIAHCLLEILFPPNYPMQVTPPEIRIEWFVLTQKSLVVANNKPLESLGTLEEGGLLEALHQQAQELVGMPCLYEILDSWWSEHIFEYISLNPTTTTIL